MADRSQGYDRIPLGLVAVLAIFLVVGLAASRFGASAPKRADALPDLSSAQFVEVRNASGRTVLSGEFRERIDALGNVNKDAALVERGGRHVIGEIEIRIPGPAAMMTDQELDIDIIELKPNAKHSIFIDDREVAMLTSDDRGSIETKLHSGSPDADLMRRTRPRSEGPANVESSGDAITPGLIR